MFRKLCAACQRPLDQAQCAPCGGCVDQGNPQVEICGRTACWLLHYKVAHAPRALVGFDLVPWRQLVKAIPWW